VEANEAMRRIIWRHRWLLIVFLIAPVALIVPLRLAQPVTYVATANIQAQGTPPQVDTEVSAILSRVSAIATSDSRLGASEPASAESPRVDASTSDTRGEGAAPARGPGSVWHPAAIAATESVQRL